MLKTLAALHHLCSRLLFRNRTAIYLWSGSDENLNLLIFFEVTFAINIQTVLWKNEKEFLSY